VAVDRRAEHGPAVVVEVIAEQFDPSRRERHPVRLPAVAEGEPGGGHRPLLDRPDLAVRRGIDHV
jgi:hypothetical protein